MLSEQNSVHTSWEANQALLEDTKFGWMAKPNGKDQSRMGQGTAGQTLNRAQLCKILGEEGLGKRPREKRE